MLSTSEHNVLPPELYTNTVDSFNATSGMLNTDLLSPVQTRLQVIASSDDFLARALDEQAHSGEIQTIHAQLRAEDFSIFPKLQMLDAVAVEDAVGTYSEATQMLALSDALFGIFGDAEASSGNIGELRSQEPAVLWGDEPCISRAFVSDWAGNTLATARDIILGPTAKTFTDWVGSTDTLDYYRFTLTETSTVNLGLTGLRADVQVGIRYANGSSVCWRCQPGDEARSTTLNPETYFIFVEIKHRNSDTFYNLIASATPTRPVVTIQATDTTAAETNPGQTPNPGRFTLTRTGSTANPLTVNYTISGTATRGTDYNNLTGTVTFAAGSNTTFIDINPINDTLVEPSETVVLTLLGSSTYQVGASNTATVTILDNDVASLSIPPLTGFNSVYGYGLVNAAAAVARGIGQNSPFPNVPNLGGNNWGNDLVNAPEVWARGYTGNGVVVAVVDTGVDYNHSDLNDNIWRNPREIAGNGLDDDGNGYIDDVHGWDFINNDNDPLDRNGHGTHVAGTIAAENNGFGVTGVAYHARIMPVQVLGDDGFGSSRAVANGIRYAANNGAHVINLSLGSNLPSPDIYSAIEYATSRGVVVVMAAGNDGDPRPDYPAFYATEFGLSVGAVDSNQNIAQFSNRAGTDSAMRHVVAPGVSIYSTVPNNRYASYSGTSMATPHVAGVVALMLSANPNLTPAQVRDIIAGSATRLV